MDLSKNDHRQDLGSMSNQELEQLRTEINAETIRRTNLPKDRMAFYMDKYDEILNPEGLELEVKLKIPYNVFPYMSQGKLIFDVSPTNGGFDIEDYNFSNLAERNPEYKLCLKNIKANLKAFKKELKAECKKYKVNFDNVLQTIDGGNSKEIL